MSRATPKIEPWTTDPPSPNCLSFSRAPQNLSITNPKSKIQTFGLDLGPFSSNSLCGGSCSVRILDFWFLILDFERWIYHTDLDATKRNFPPTPTRVVGFATNIFHEMRSTGCGRVSQANRKHLHGFVFEPSKPTKLKPHKVVKNWESSPFYANYQICVAKIRPRRLNWPLWSTWIIRRKSNNEVKRENQLNKVSLLTNDPWLETFLPFGVAP